MKPRVFISFSKEDMQTVMRIRNALGSQGFSPYVATDVVEPAQHISKKIENAIAKSDAFVVLLTESSVKSPWVQQEIGYAKSRIPVVPVKAEGVRPPALLEGCDCVPISEETLSGLGMVVKKAIKEFTPPSGREVCDEGPYLIRPGEYNRVQLNVRNGDHVTGRIEETDGDEFDWYLLNEKNFVKFRTGEDPVAARCGVNVGASLVNWQVKGTGPWFLVLSLYGKKNSREVTVNLRK